MNRYRVFISSTIQDLENARTSTASAIDTLEVFEARRSEDLPAFDMPSRVVCLDEVRQADLVVLILGSRYGFIPTSNNPNNLSVTHLEYREATRLRKPVFAFILDTQQIEEPLRKLLSEVEDFDSGVFRKKWKSLSELTNHIRRSLLWWIARKARNNESLRFGASEIISLVNKSQLGVLPYQLQVSAATESALSWVRTVLQKFAGSINPNRLLPVLQETTANDSAMILVSIELGEIPSNYTITIRSNLSGEQDAYIQMGVPTNNLGESLFGDIFRAFVYLMIDDPSACVDLLLRWSKRNAIADANRAALIVLVVRLSMRYDLERVLEAGEGLLDLRKVERDVFASAITALFETNVRLHRKQLPVANRRAERLSVALLSKSLQEGTGGAEEVYTLARHALQANLDIAAEMYFELLRIHPYYEGRWYWHRDLGLFYYSRAKFSRAAAFYDTTITLKPNYARLYRFAGDAYYYQGKWALALERFQKAVELERTEEYVLDMKIAFARSKLTVGTAEERYFLLRRKLAQRVSRVGSLFALTIAPRIAASLFRFALLVNELNFDAANWLALYANRRGDYKSAVHMLSVCLATAPEDSAVRLNLAADLVFENEGKITEVAKKHLKAAIFNGGQRTRERFALLLTNTLNSFALLTQFDLLLSTVKAEWEDAEKRRLEIANSEKYGSAIHIEI